MRRTLLAAAMSVVLCAAPIWANCTSFAWENQDGSLHFLGRTYDMFGDLSGNRISVAGRGYEMSLSLDGSRTEKMDYGFVGISVIGLPSPIIVDGINEKGLMGALLNFPGYGHFNTQKDAEHTDIHPAFFVGYLLGTCSSVEEVAEKVSTLNLTDELVYGSLMSVHYIFSDSTGEAIIIEPDEDGITVHRNTIGVMANAPGYDWQKTNLKNYVSISNIDPPPRTIAGEQFSAFGSGTGGSFGLPGGYSSPARFVRMAFMKEFAPKGTDEMDSVTRMFNSFGVVYIPDGILRKSADSTDCEQTLCTSVMCSESLTYYFSPYTDRRVSAVSVPAAIDKAGDGNLMYIDIPAEQDVNRLI